MKSIEEITKIAREKTRGRSRAQEGLEFKIISEPVNICPLDMKEPRNLEFWEVNLGDFVAHRQKQKEDQVRLIKPIVQSWQSDSGDRAVDESRLY